MSELSKRAIYRLDLAKGILPSMGHKRIFRKDHFYQDLLAFLNSMNPAEYEKLKGMVDWVEQYEIAEAGYAGYR